MFLTKFEINTTRRGAKHLLGSPQRMHAAVMGAFPPSVTQGQRILWRVDRNGHEAVLYLVSPSKPDLSGLVEDAGWPTTATWQTHSYLPFLDRLEVGQRYSFRLTANPSHVARVGTDGPKKRLGHVTEAHQMKWLLDRAEVLGIDVGKEISPGHLEANESTGGGVSFWISQRDALSFRRQEKEAATNRGASSSAAKFRQVTITTATYEGTLTVKDPVPLKDALVSGVGRAKAYGCGLLTLAPIMPLPVA